MEQPGLALLFHNFKHSVQKYFLMTRGERKLLLRFQLGEGLKLIMCQSDSILSVWKVQDA